MQNFARVENGKVVETFRHPSDPTPLFMPEWLWIACPDDIRPGCSWSEAAGFFNNPPAPDDIPHLPPLDQRKSEISAAVNRKRDVLLSGGYTHDFGAQGVHVLQTRDADDRINWLTSQAAYQAAVASGFGNEPGAEFRTAGNQRITLTFSEGLNVLLAMAGWGKAVFGRSWDIKDAIAAAADDAALDAIDIEAGWPETPA